MGESHPASCGNLLLRASLDEIRQTYWSSCEHERSCTIRTSTRTAYGEAIQRSHGIGQPCLQYIYFFLSACSICRIRHQSKYQPHATVDNRPSIHLSLYTFVTDISCKS